MLLKMQNPFSIVLPIYRPNLALSCFDTKETQKKELQVAILGI